MKPKRITFFGNFGNGNLGNESTLQAILHNLRQDFPDAEFNCICTGPETTARTHNIAAFSMKGLLVRLGPLADYALARFLWGAFLGIPSELYRWYSAFKVLKGTDMFIVPGTQFLSDNLCGPFAWVYLAFKWSVIAKIRRCKLVYVSVGVGPLRHPLSRYFVKTALSLADYRSYRDEMSRQYVLRIGFDASTDPVYPDLAFSLPVDPTSLGDHCETSRPVVAVGVKNYHGQYGPWPLQGAPEDIYRHYIEEMSGFLTWLLENMYTVRLVIGDITYDTPVLVDLRKSLNGQKAKSGNLEVIHEKIESVEQLLSHLAASDIVISPRFHNVVLGLLLNRPVIALAYHEKFSALLEGPEIAEYNLHIDNLDSNTLIEKFIKIDSCRASIKLRIGSSVSRYRTALDEQYKIIFKYLRNQ